MLTEQEELRGRELVGITRGSSSLRKYHIRGSPVRSYVAVTAHGASVKRSEIIARVRTSDDSNGTNRGAEKFGYLNGHRTVRMEGF